MEKEAFQEWLDNPVTEYVFKYLKDSVKEEVELIAESIASGGIISENEQISKSAICATLIRIAEIDYEEIDGFYEKED